MRHLMGAFAAAVIGLSATIASAADISGAGATFPFPIYAKWAEAYKKETGNGLNYQSIGSGGGIKQITAKTVTFGASDAPLKGADLDKNGLMQWPQIMGGVVPTVNLPGIEPGQLVLDGATIAQLYMGKIAKWNDAAIQKLNPDLKLPSVAVAPVYRSDGSGTTFLFTNYLTKTSPAFASDVGAATAVQWPVGIGAKGNEGVANMVRQTAGALGYVEYAYVKQNKMTYARMINQAGKTVEPSAESFQAAAANADWKSEPGFGVVLTDEPGDASWPITGASFILIHKVPQDAEAARAALSFFDWAFENGDKLADELDYVPMPDAVVDQIKASWSQITTADGKALRASN